MGVFLFYHITDSNAHCCIFCLHLQTICIARIQTHHSTPGLGTIYLINTVLAVFAAISAPSRKQPSALWAVKTFAVGGIAYDQLMQIPTPEELAEKARREEEAMSARGRGRRGKKQ